MGWGSVRDFRTSWWCIRNGTSERSERLRFVIQTRSVKIPYKRPAHEVIYLFHTCWLNITSFYLGKVSLSRKNDQQINLRNKGQLKPTALKNTSFVGLYKCCELKYWQKIDQKWNTIFWRKTVYDDYIIKWPPKKPNNTINKKALTKNFHWNGTAGGLSSSDESRTRLMRL